MAAVPSIGRASLVEAPSRAPQAAATAGLYERHSAKILSYCLHQLGSREEAEDAVQTTFMNAFRALGRGVVPEAESAWLFKIAENVCLSRRRSSWRRGRIESPSDFDIIEEIVPGPSRQRNELIGIEDALAAMPEQQRRAILLREWQGLSYREIADELEVSQSAVETLIFRARRSLANGLEQPDLLKKPKRKSFRRALHIIDLGTIAAAAKTLLAGSAAVKATAAVVAVTAAAGTAATVKVEGHSPRAAAPAPALAAPAPTAAFAAAPAGSVSPGGVAQASAPDRDEAASASASPARTAPVRAPASPERVAPAASQPLPTSPSTGSPAAAPLAPAPAEQPAEAAPDEPAKTPAVEQPIRAAVAEGPKSEEEPGAEEKQSGRGGGNGKAASAPPTPATPTPVAAHPSGKDWNEERRDRKSRDLASAPAAVDEPPVQGAAFAPAEAPVAPADAASGAAAPDHGKGQGGRKK